MQLKNRQPKKIWSQVFENSRKQSIANTRAESLLSWGVKVKVKVELLSHIWLFATPWTVAHQAPPSMGFSRQEYWSGLPLPSPSSAFSKTSLNIWKFMVHVLLKPGLENFEHYFTSVWDECNCAVVWAFFGIFFLGDWNENWPFPNLWPLLNFPNFLAYWVQHFHSIIF